MRLLTLNYHSIMRSIDVKALIQREGPAIIRQRLICRRPVPLDWSLRQPSKEFDEVAYTLSTG